MRNMLPAQPIGRTNRTGQAHYLLSAYASIEPFTQVIVVIDPTVSEPTLLLRPRARRATRSNVLALAVPNLAAITRDIATTVTHVVAPYFGVREWPVEQRRAGTMNVRACPVVSAETLREPIARPHARTRARPTIRRLSRPGSARPAT